MMKSHKKDQLVGAEPVEVGAASYDAVASEYAARLSDELNGKPLDRALLDEIAARAEGSVCDLGCGPGHVAGYLHRRGASVVGIDLSPRMIDEARRRERGPSFEVGDIRALPYRDGTFAAVVAMYSLIHFDDSGLAAALAEVHRVLRAGGVFLAGFHRGSEIVHVEELFGCPVNLDFRFFEPEQLTGALTVAGLEVERLLERDAYPDVEAQTRRFYVIAGKIGRPPATARHVTFAASAWSSL